jgi:MFS family permease
VNLTRTRVRPAAIPIYALLAGSLVSNIGNQITALAVPWFVLETTGSASKTGIAAAATLIPMAISMLFGGTIVDRMQQKHLAIFSDVMSFATVAAVPLLYHTIGLNFIALLVLMFMGAAFDTPGSTARQAMVPALAKRADLPLEKVNSWFATIGAATSLLGAPLAGILIALFGAANVLWFDAGTFLVSALLVTAFLPLAARAIPSGASFLADVREGFTYLMRQRGLRSIGLTAIVVNFLLSPLFGVVIPYFANTIYGSATKLGLIMGGFGLGALLGSVAYGQFGTRWSRRNAIIITMILFTGPIWGMTWQPNVAVMTTLAIVIGIGAGMVNPLVTTLLQQATPEHLLGRVLGTFASTAMVAAPFGMLLGGSAISLLGLTGTIALIAAIITAALVFVIANPAFRELDLPAAVPTITTTENGAPLTP